MAQSRYQVAVLGAGISGLASAVCIQESRPDCHVTILSDEFSPNTTSDGARGLWYPFYMADTDPALVNETGKVTYDYMKRLCLSPLAGALGAQLTACYFLNETSKEDNEGILDYVDGYHRLSHKELQNFNGARSGFSFETIIIDVTSYLRWLMLRFKTNGGVVECQKIDSLTQLTAGHWDVVVNCCGIGAATLFNDKQFSPVRGQVIMMDAPWIKQCYVYTYRSGALTYLIPGVNTVGVGGTSGKGDWGTELRDADDADIWQRAISVFPAITSARKVRSWAGLRPTRKSLRLEQELMDIDGQNMSVIHNYGHGGSGVTLHWGCAQKVVSMVSNILPPRISNNKGQSFKHKL